MTSPERTEETLPGSSPSPPPISPGSRSAASALQQAEKYFAGGVFSGKAAKVFEEAVAARPDLRHLQDALDICRLIQNVTDMIRRRLGETVSGPPTREQCVSIEDWFDKFPASADVAKCLGDVRLLDGDWEGAREAYQSAQAKEYRDNQAIVNSGRVALSNPGCPAGVLRYFGEAALSLGQFSQAVEFLIGALHRSGDDREATTGLLQLISERLLPLLDPSPQKQAVLTEMVRASLELGLMDQALAAFAHIELTGFARGDLVKRIARHLIDHEDYRQAFDYLSRIPFDPDTKSLVNEIAVNMEREGEIDTAVHLLRYINEHDLVIKQAQRAAEDRLESAATLELAELCFRTGRFDAALSHYLVLLRHDSPEIAQLTDRIETAAMQAGKVRAEDMLGVGEYFFRRRDWRRAENFLHRGLSLDPNHSRLQQLLRSVYDTLLKTDSNPDPIRLRSGDLYLAASQIDQAVEEYKKVLDSPGFEAEARRRLAIAYLKAGEPKSALEQYRDLSLQASDLEVLYQLHEHLMTAALFSEALEAATLLREFDSHYRDIQERILQLEQTLRQPDAAQPFSDPKMVELIGDQAVGRYRYIEQIGSGGMGVVHKVYDLKSQTIVAMKILRESLTGSSKAIDRFFREARIAATFTHPNIVNIFDYNINSVYGKSYISMEFVDGPSLRGIIEERFSVSSELTAEYIAEILDYTYQLCDALETTHTKGIIHRDIKPDNVMITSDGVVKITDFGIVHIEAATFTPTGALIGTPRYMSPEQVRGGRVDCRSDIYAVGIIVYEALLGTPPFISGDVAYQHVNVPPPPPRAVNPAIPEPVEEIILHCLEKDPSRRYQRAKETGLAVQSVLESVYPKIYSRFRNRRVTSTLDSPAATQ
jgi:tetratricopeptide (TPR) repeat protein